MISFDDVKIDDLKEEQQEVVDIIGLHAYKQLMKYYAGTSIYIPKLSEIERTKRNVEIRKEYEDGVNMKYLAIKYDLTEMQIRNIVFDLYQEKKSAPAKGQMNIFDL